MTRTVGRGATNGAKVPPPEYDKRDLTAQGVGTLDPIQVLGIVHAVAERDEARSSSGGAVARYEIAAGASEVRLRAETSIRPVTLVATEIAGFIDVEIAPDGSVCEDCACRVRLLVEALHSGNPVLDRRGARHFDADQHPEVSAELCSVVPYWRDACDATWLLSFHGVTRAVRGSVTLEHLDDATICLDGGQVIDVRNWGVRLPSLPLIRVHPDVSFAVRLIARRTDATAREGTAEDGQRRQLEGLGSEQDTTAIVPSERVEITNLPHTNPSNGLIRPLEHAHPRVHGLGQKAHTEGSGSTDHRNFRSGLGSPDEAASAVSGLHRGEETQLMRAGVREGMHRPHG